MTRWRAFFFPEGSRPRAAPFAVVSTIGVMLGLAAGTSDLAQRLDWALYDRFSRAAATALEPAPDIVIVAIDEPSFSEMALPWPWPRTLHAELTRALARGGARTIVFDLLFDVPAPGAGEDAAFARAMAETGTVVLVTDRAEVEDRRYGVVQWIDPVEPLAAAAAATGVIRIGLDPDGAIRRAPLTVDGRPSLALQAARRAPGFRAPGDADAPVLLRFRGPPRIGITTVSYYQALAPETSLPPGIFEGKTVFVGFSLAAPASVEATADHFKTPVSARMAGVEIHATALDTLLRDAAIADPFGRPLHVVALILVAGALSCTLLYRLPLGIGAAVVGAAATAWGLAGFGLLAWAGTRIPVVTPLAGLVAACAASAAYRYGLVARERLFIRRTFEHYVAPAIVRKMLDDPSQLTLVGEEFEVSVIFTDLEGFTTMAETLPPVELQRHLSAYFTEMVSILLGERATLDKLIGDSIMAYFGCPVRDPEHALQACRGALAMQRRMLEVNRAWRGLGLPLLRTRMGISTGRVVAGNMGTPTVFNYTVLGDTVNLASRLEGANKAYGSEILLAADTWALVKDQFEGRELDFIRVQGKTQPVAVYELAAEKGALTPERQALFARFADGLREYRNGRWGHAAAAFRDALAIDPADGPSQVFVGRCAHYEVHPPPGDWAGVHVMKSK